MKMILFCMLFIVFTDSSAQYKQQNRLSNTYTPEILEDVLLSAEEWHPFPTYDERPAWEKLPETVKTEFIKKGESALNEEWPKVSGKRSYVSKVLDIF